MRRFGAQRPAHAARRAALAGLGTLAIVAPLSAAGATLVAHAGSVLRTGAGGEVPTAGALYKDGPSGRYLLGGTWLYRSDGGVGLRQHFEEARSPRGWRAVSVPNAWNAGERTAAAYAPAVGWYRKDFVLPSSAPGYTWIARFESINNSVTIWLNGHEIAVHTGAFLAFEVVLPAAYLNRTAVNRLVLRVSDAHTLTDLPPLSPTPGSDVVAGWWNYGGPLREVYLRRVDEIDLAGVSVLPSLACVTCDATVAYRVVVHNYAAAARVVALRTRYGTVDAGLGSQTIAAGASATFVGLLTIPQPSLWSPADPHLYAVTLDATATPPGATTPVAGAHYFLESGIRQVSVIDGHLYLNFEPLHLRGVGLVEDSLSRGAALDRAQQRAAMEAAKALGATIIRSQYPLSGYEEQLADELGIMLWSEIPVYQVRDSELRAVTPTALAMLRENILENGNHPSIVVWSIANELNPDVGAAQSAYIAAATALAHRLDPTRPVALAYQGSPSTSCQAGYRPLQLLGVNEYFGWYPGPTGRIAKIGALDRYLDRQHACYPKQAMMITEFGAEANRSGPADERGTYAFQSRFVRAQLAAVAAAPWLSGAIYWALKDFLVRPGWTGGNPEPTPPLFAKGLLHFDGAPKPAWTIVQRAFAHTDQLG